MRELRCSRCNREGPGADQIDAAWSRAARTDPSSVSDLLNDSWARIDGVDVCPSCQTDSDKAQVARRLVDIVENAVKGNDDNDVDPSPGEDAVIGFAMQMREALAAWGGEGDEDRSSTAADASRTQRSVDHSAEKNREFEVAITGAFLTGCPMHIRSSKYNQVQYELATALEAHHPEKGWTARVAAEETGTYSTGGGFSTAVHLILVGRTGDDALARTRSLLGQLPVKEHQRQKKIAPGWTLTPKSMRIELYDLGVGVIDGAFTVSVPNRVGDCDLIQKLNEIVDLHPKKNGRFSSAISNALAQLCDEATKEFRSAVAHAREWLMDPWLEMDPAVTGELGSARPRPLARRQVAPDANSEKSAEWGRLLWLHPVLLLTAPTEPERKATAQRVAPAFSTTLSVQDGVFVPGIGASAIITTSPEMWDVPLKLLRLHWAYFALYMEIDRGLLGLLNRFDTKRSERRRLHDLEVEADDAFDSYIRVIQARARVESTLASLGGDEQAIWDSIAKVQKYRTIVSGVDKKVDALRNITDRRAQQASSAQAQRATRSLGLLAALGLISLVIASFGYFFGAVTTNGDERNRVVPFIVGLFVALALWWWINFTKLRQRRQRR